MKKYNFDEVVDRRPYLSMKWSIPQDGISLSIADTDFVVTDEIKAEIARINEHGRFGYTGINDDYFNSYVHWFSNRYQASFEAKDCIFSTGVVVSLDCVIKKLLKVGDGVMMFTPTYNVFYNCIKNNGCILIDCPFIYNNYHYEINWELMEKDIKKAKAFILCNPHNPIGRKFNDVELAKMVAICRENDVYLLSDEIHSDIDYNQDKYVSTLKDIHYEKLITFLSPGKTFNLAGLHSSIIVIKNKELKEIIQSSVYHDDIGEPSYFSITPVIKAYEFGEDYVRQLNNYLYKNKMLVKDFINKHKKLHLIGGNFTYLLWIDISSYGLDSDTFVKRLIDETGLVVSSGNIYGDSRFIRINIATSSLVLKDALDRLEIFISKL